MTATYSTNSMKHAQNVPLGGWIKAYMRQPVRDAYGHCTIEEDMFIVGRVVGIDDSNDTKIAKSQNAVYGKVPFRYNSYDVVVVATSHGQFDIDQVVYVPYEIENDFDGRVVDCITTHGKLAKYGDHAIREDVADIVDIQKKDCKFNKKGAA